MTTLDAGGITSSADVEARARSYLRDGRITLLDVTPDRIRGEARGTGPGPWTVTWTLLVGWRCTCPAVAVCTHIVAVQLVTVRNLPEIP